jgi:hypothetical protein
MPISWGQSACVVMVAIAGAWGCASAASLTSKDGGIQDSAPEPPAPDANTHPPPGDAGLGVGKCARQLATQSCKLPTSCSESWGNSDVAVQQGCQYGIVSGNACPIGAMIGYCIAPPALRQLGDVEYYYTGAGDATSLEGSCSQINGTWCLPP